MKTIFLMRIIWKKTNTRELHLYDSQEADFLKIFSNNKKYSCGKIPE
jgi:hypothetical protein